MVQVTAGAASHNTRHLGDGQIASATARQRETVDMGAEKNIAAASASANAPSKDHQESIMTKTGPHPCRRWRALLWSRFKPLRQRPQTRVSLPVPGEGGGARAQPRYAERSSVLRPWG